MASSSSQMATVQMDALNTVCLQFADADKKTLKRKLVEVSNDRRSDYKMKVAMKESIFWECTDHLLKVQKQLKKGTETGLTLSPEEVQRLWQDIQNARVPLEELNDQGW